MNKEPNNKNDTLTSEDHQVRLIKLATYAAVIVAIILVVCKYYAWRITNSVSLEASLIDSILDTMASLVNFVVVRQAIKPADKEHRFGHGKAESLAGLGQSAFIAGSALWLFFDIIHRLWEPEPIVSSEVGTKVMLVAVALTLGLVLFQRYVVKKTRSLAIKADSLHYQSDLLTNLGVLASLNITAVFGWHRLDPIVGAIIAAYILYTSWEIAKRALDELMDRELPDAEREKISHIAYSHPDVYGVHDLRTRTSGRQYFVQLHLDLKPDLSLEEAHEIAEEVEFAIIETFPQAEVIIHQDPMLEEKK